MYQILGELDHIRNDGSNSNDPIPLILRSRVAMNVDGIDIALFKKALQIRRKYEFDRGLLQRTDQSDHLVQMLPLSLPKQ